MAGDHYPDADDGMGYMNGLRRKDRTFYDHFMHANIWAIILYLIIAETYPNQSLSQRTNDRALTKALAASKLTVLPIVVISAGPGLKALPPMLDFLNAACGIGHIHLELDPADVACSVFLQEG